MNLHIVQPKMFNKESSTVYKNMIKSKNLNKNCKPIFKTNLLVQTLQPLQNLKKILEKPKAFNFY